MAGRLSLLLGAGKFLFFWDIGGSKRCGFSTNWCLCVLPVPFSESSPCIHWCRDARSRTRTPFCYCIAKLCAPTLTFRTKWWLPLIPFYSAGEGVMIMINSTIRVIKVEYGKGKTEFISAQIMTKCGAT